MPHKPILILNGPNLNLLGSREPGIYGAGTLADIHAACEKKAKSLGFSLDFRQSNHEGELVDWIQTVRGDFCGLILNAGAYTHTSVALHDALKTVEKPVIEVHISNIYKRESFRHHSYISPVATGVICGLGTNSYLLAVQALADILGAE